MEKITFRKLIDETAIPSDYNPEPFNEIEKQTIIDNAKEQLRNIIQFGFWSGLRISELIALKWIDIDFEEKLYIFAELKYVMSKKQKLKLKQE